MRTCKLSDVAQGQALLLNETGMGYQMVDCLLDDTTELKNRVILNGSLLVILPDEEDDLGERVMVVRDN